MYALNWLEHKIDMCNCIIKFEDQLIRKHIFRLSDGNSMDYYASQPVLKCNMKKMWILDHDQPFQILNEFYKKEFSKFA